MINAHMRYDKALLKNSLECVPSQCACLLLFQGQSMNPITSILLSMVLSSMNLSHLVQSQMQVAVTLSHGSESCKLSEEALNHFAPLPG